MNPSRIELALVFEHLRLPFDLDTFAKRLCVQKKIYLGQLTGLDLGYRFGWYLRGPYSTGLTSDAFTLIDDLLIDDQRNSRHEYKQFELRPETVAFLAKAERLWARSEEVACSLDEWLELLASLHYLRQIAYWPPRSKKSFDEVFQKLVQAKPRFSKLEEAATLAWKRLDEFGLIKNKTMVAGQAGG